ncbi:hypothetical protein DHEL01_v210526 [Diaporthe helianthi]|uniref:Uncharacterized protein n=1 Tax=Diaporthe helianthi TaxID=158607 RepID=A0A2P5HLF1_DIAHE|nr:hypothetical protein DHEL01_v210526 [Diaporthe helianthi]
MVIAFLRPTPTPSTPVCWKAKAHQPWGTLLVLKRFPTGSPARPGGAVDNAWTGGSTYAGFMHESWSSEVTMACESCVATTPTVASVCPAIINGPKLPKLNCQHTYRHERFHRFVLLAIWNKTSRKNSGEKTQEKPSP